MNRLSVYGLLLVLIYLIIRSGGGEKKMQNTQQTSFIARVGKQYLYPSDLESLDVVCADLADNASLINQYVTEWACKQLLIAQGNQDGQYIEPSIESNINAYKEDLLAYHFLETFVRREFNDDLSPEEIADYYHKHKQNDFILNHDIVKGTFLAIPKRADGINSVKSLMLSKKPADRKKLKSYAKPYANTSIIAHDKWISWETVLAKVGYCPVGDATRLLKTNKFIHVTGRKYIYLLKIDQYKIAQEIAPLEAVEERIRATLLHKRRLELIKKIKNNLLQSAKKNHICVIHAN